VPVLLFSLLFSTVLSAQEPTSYLDPGEVYEAPDPNTPYEGDFNPNLLLRACDAPKVESKAVIWYNSYIMAHVTLREVGGRPITLNVQGLEANTVAVTPVENQLFLNQLAPNALYELKSVNSCGEPIVLATISTYPYNRGSGIEVSDKLFRALTEYTKPEGQQTGLHVYLQNLNDVDLYERVAFAQRYLLGGTRLPDNTYGTFPMATIQTTVNPPGGEIRQECQCDFVINRSLVAVPDKIVGNLEVDDQVHNGIEGPMDKNGRWWINRTDEGPAKKYELYSDGVNNGSNVQKQSKLYGLAPNQDSKSPNYAQTGYILLCVGYPGVLPKDCACSKSIRASFGYTAEVEARANIVRARPGAKRSAAIAQEYAIGYTIRNNGSSYDVQIVDAGLVTATAKCEGGLPAMAIVDGALLVIGIINAIKDGAFEDYNPNAGQVNGIRNQIEAYIDKYGQGYDCTSGSNKQTLLQKETNLTLNANETVFVCIASGTALQIEGKRSWKNHAKSTSSFHLTSAILGGYQGNSPNFCCNDYAAQWVWGSQLGDDSSLAAMVRSFVNLQLPFTLNRSVNDVPVPQNTLPINTEIGHATGDFTGCQFGEIPIQPSNQ